MANIAVAPVAPAPVAPAPGAAPAPLPNNNNNVIPIVGPPPPLSAKMANWAVSDKFFVNFKNRSHGKQHLARYMRSLGLTELGLNLLPDPSVIFYWVQREYLFENVNYMQTPANKFPCIAYIHSQLTMCEKVKMAENLLHYYGMDYAWQVTPETYDACYDFDTEHWNISHLKSIIANSTNTWIVKSNIGSLGSEVFLWQGNTIEKFRTFLENKFQPDLWKEMLDARELASEVRLNMIILQTYVDRPLLYKNKFKFDLRTYVLTASCNPTMAFFHIGKMRLCAVEYKPFVYEENIIANKDSKHSRTDKSNEMQLYSHLTNCKIQRCHKNYDHLTSQIDGQSMLADWQEFIEFMYDVAVRQHYFAPEWFDPSYDAWNTQCKTSPFSQFNQKTQSEIKTESKISDNNINDKNKNEINEDVDIKTLKNKENRTKTTKTKENKHHTGEIKENENKNECKDNEEKRDYSKYPTEKEFSLSDMSDLINRKCMNLVAKSWNSIGDIYDNDSILNNRPCQFAFHGIDILIDDDGQFWLIEVNRCPSISLLGFESIQNMTKEMLNECVDIELKIREIKQEFYRKNNFDFKNKQMNPHVILDKLNEAQVVKHWKYVPLQYLNQDFRQLRKEKQGVFKGLQKNSNVKLLNNVEKIKQKAPTHSVL